TTVKKGVPSTIVTLVSFTDDIYCIGPRRISAQLKRYGFDTNLVFLTTTDLVGQLKHRFSKHYDEGDIPEDLYQQLLAICKTSAVVGFSVWTHQAEQVTKLTNRLRKDFDGLIVWGGIHPTSYPEESIEIVDAICMGEGDVSFLRLVQAVSDG